MSKIMTLEVLSSIKGAKSSEAVNELFEVIKKAVPLSSGGDFLQSGVQSAVSLNSLRDDVVIASSEEERRLIRENFPKEKKGFLVVSKVIED
ncbi:MAG: hypothetical protein JW717_10825 [Marinilabiliaceae bacterium]|nr:hypothetical protein [Marinilabiliaceae bacterium]